MKCIRFLSLAAGILLLVVNIYGLFKSMRNTDLYNETNTGRLNDITIRLEDAKKQLKRNPGESDKEYAIRTNEIVNKSMMHYWKAEGIKKYNLRVPFWENYVLFLSRLTADDKRYEFQNYKKNLERGVGLCSTHSIVVKEVLKRNGIKAYLWDIAGHVVVRAKVSENEWYILDPDFGYYIPHDINEIEANPEIVRTVYKNMSELYKPDYNDPYTTEHVVELYGREGNHIYADSPVFENLSYILIWLIPVLLIFPFIFHLLRRRSPACQKLSRP